MNSLLKMSVEKLEEMITDFLTKRMGEDSVEASEFWYFVINDSTLLIKVYAGNLLIFTVKAKLNGNGLEPLEVS